MCAVSAGFSAMELLTSRDPARTPGCLIEIAGRSLGAANPAIAALELTAALAFALLFWRLTRTDTTARLAPLALQSLIGLTLGPELLGMVSFLAPLTLSRPAARNFVAALVPLQTAAYFLQLHLTGSHPLAKLMPGVGLGVTMAMVAATTLVWNGITFALGLLAVEERRRAQQLARANAELAATRQLEAETARVAVRLGISRDLHDASGHHLAALNVNLRLMRHLEDPTEIRQKTDECLFVVAQLLQEVRTVVKDLRSLQRIDLLHILTTMAAGFDGISVHLDLDPALARAEPFYAHTLFRCAQEILTNAAKHAEARNVWLSIRQTDSGYRVEGRDDGNGASDIQYGNGLTGMRERVAECGGDFEVHSRAGHGFAVRLHLPVRGAAA
jgi:signal transduction histidine kinase